LLHVPKEDAQKAQAAMFSDPNMAMDMMKKNLSMIVPQVRRRAYWFIFYLNYPLYLLLTDQLVLLQTLTFAWVNFFFSGFVAGMCITFYATVILVLFLMSFPCCAFTSCCCKIATINS
jgi:hypothetical protein